MTTFILYNEMGFLLSSVGCGMGSFMLFYCVLALYGTALLYNNVKTSGCDPGGAVKDNDTCQSDGAGVFGAMIGTKAFFVICLLRDVTLVNVIRIWSYLHILQGLVLQHRVLVNLVAFQKPLRMHVWLFTLR
jgi:hypothetical protein